MFKKLTKLKIKKLPLILGVLLLTIVTVPLIASADFLDEMLWTLVNQTFGRFVALGGSMLNYAISEFVVGFGNMYITTGLGLAIDDVWGIIRDVFNLFFIFGLVYIGFKMILDSSNSSAKRSLVYIFLAALLINFSLFFSKVVVDFSNIAASQIASASDFKMRDNNGAEKFAISNRFMDVYGLSKIFSSKDTNGGTQELSANFETPNATGFGSVFYTLIIYIVTGFVFIAGAFLLIIRFVSLLFFLVLSPVMFIGWIFPFFANYSKEYWNKFLGQAFFAPAYMLMLLISIRVFEKFRDFLSDKSIIGVVSPSENKSAGDSMNDTAPYFIVMSAFLIGSIIIAKKMGSTGADMVQRGRKVAQAAAGAVVLGGGAYLAQRTVGSGANRIRESDSFKRFAAKNQRLGKLAGKSLDKVGDASFDARNLSITRGELGKGKKGGNTTWKKKQKKENDAFMESLETQTRDTNGELKEEVRNEAQAAIQERGERIETKIQEVQNDIDNKVADIKLDNNYDSFKEGVDSQKARIDQAKEAEDAIRTDLKRAEDAKLKAEADLKQAEAEATAAEKGRIEANTEKERAAFRKIEDEAEVAKARAITSINEAVSSIKDKSNDLKKASEETHAVSEGYDRNKQHLDNLDTEISNETSALNSELSVLKERQEKLRDPKEQEKFIKEMESEIKYQHIVGRRKNFGLDQTAAEARESGENWQKGYLDHSEDSIKSRQDPRKNLAYSAGAAAAGAAVAGTVAFAPVVVPAALAGGALAAAATYTTRKLRSGSDTVEVNNILKEYGRDGQNREKNKKKEKEISAIIEKIKKDGGLGENTPVANSQGSSDSSDSSTT